MKAQIVYNEFCGLRLRLKSSFVITSLLNEEGPTCQRTHLTNTPYSVIHTDPTTDRYGQMPNQEGCIITDVAIRPFYRDARNCVAISPRGPKTAPTTQCVPALTGSLRLSARGPRNIDRGNTIWPSYLVPI